MLGGPASVCCVCYHFMRIVLQFVCVHELHIVVAASAAIPMCIVCTCVYVCVLCAVYVCVLCACVRVRIVCVCAGVCVMRIEFAVCAICTCIVCACVCALGVYMCEDKAYQA